MPSGFCEVTRWPPRTLWRALRIASRDGAVAVEELAPVAADLGHGEQQVLGRDELVAEAPGLFLRQFHHPLGARVERQRAALDLRPPAEDPGQLVAECREIDADPAERLGGHAVIGLDERVEDVLHIEHGTVQLLGDALGSDDRLLGLFGIAVKFHRGLRVQSALRGSGWSTSSRKVRGRLLGLGVQPRRQHDSDFHQGIAHAGRAQMGHALAGQLEDTAVLRARRYLQQHTALEGRDRYLAAEQRLLEGDR